MAKIKCFLIKESWDRAAVVKPQFFCTVLMNSVSRLLGKYPLFCTLNTIYIIIPHMLHLKLLLISRHPL